MTDNYQSRRVLANRSGLKRFARPPEHRITQGSDLLLSNQDWWVDPRGATVGQPVGGLPVGGQAVGDTVLDCLATIDRGVWTWVEVLDFTKEDYEQSPSTDYHASIKVQVSPGHIYSRYIGVLAGCPSDFFRFLSGEFLTSALIRRVLNAHARKCLLDAMKDDAWLGPLAR